MGKTLFILTLLVFTIGCSQNVEYDHLTDLCQPLVGNDTTKWDICYEAVNTACDMEYYGRTKVINPYDGTRYELLWEQCFFVGLTGDFPERIKGPSDYHMNRDWLKKNHEKVVRSCERWVEKSVKELARNEERLKSARQAE